MSRKGGNVKHVKQRWNECALAAACMAKEVNYFRWSDKFENEFGQTWADAINKPITVWKTREFLHRILGKDTFHTGTSIPRGGSKNVHTMRRRPRLGGNGVLTIVSTVDYSRHAVAYSSGVIYDSDRDGPMTWEAWASNRRLWKIDGQHKITP